MGIKKRICRTLMWPKDYPQIKPLKRISHREIPITNFFYLDVLTLIGNHGPPGPATDRSESVRHFQIFEHREIHGRSMMNRQIGPYFI